MARGEKEQYVDQTPFKENVRQRLDADFKRGRQLDPSDDTYGGDKSLAKFDGTLTRFSQNAKGDFQVLLAVPYEYKEAVLSLAKAHGILLRITVNKWSNDNGD